MLFHIIIEISNSKNNLEKFDVKDEEIILNKYVKPYLNGEDFFFDGQMINKIKITSFKIFRTDIDSSTLRNKLQANLNEQNARSNVTVLYSYTKAVSVQKEGYTTDVTEEFIEKGLNNDDSLLNKRSAQNLENFDTNSIFIVHGHNEVIKEKIARFLEKLGFQAIILHECPDSGQTIIEKLESNTNVGFAIVLYTACDIGASKRETDNLKKRARQNVVFEHGYLLGKLGRSRVYALLESDLEIPSDINGVGYTLLKEETWKIKLVQELKNAGYPADANKIF